MPLQDVQRSRVACLLQVLKSPAHFKQEMELVVLFLFFFSPTGIASPPDHPCDDVGYSAASLQQGKTLFCFVQLLLLCCFDL